MLKKIRIVIEAIICGVLVFVFTITTLFSSLDFIIKDNLYQIPRGVNSSIKIIAIDEKTLEKYGPIGTWSRSIYGDIINVLNSNDDAKPAVIAFDILFSGNVDEGDDAFAKAANESGNVVTTAQFIYDERGYINSEGIFEYPITDIVYPYEALKNNAYIGFSNISQDSDSVVRRITTKESYNGNDIQMFPKEIYDVYCKNTGLETKEIPTDKYGRTLINYSGKPGDYEAISLADLLDGKIDSRAFKNSIILIGAYAPGMQDNFIVPNGKSNQMYGVEIHANIIQSFMEDRFAINGNPYLFAGIFGILAMIIHLIFRKSKVVISAVILVISIAAELFAGVVLNNKGITISLIYFPVVIAISYIYCLAAGYILERFKKKEIINAFKKYVAPEVIEEISKSGDFNVTLGVQERDIAVLFVDIRGFTTMSEGMEPAEVVAILNEYLNLTTNSVFKNKGTLDKFVGDATMAVFNSPIDLDDYEFRAVQTALDIVKGGEKLEKELMKKYGRTVGFGVGVHCGKAVVGNIGCDFRMDFTAIGDTVNTSARLEANAKKGQVLISEELYNRLKGRIDVTKIGAIPLKGKSNEVIVYQVNDVVSSNQSESES